MTSRSETKGRRRSISNRHFEERRRRLSKTTPSTISGDTTRDTTSTSIIAVGTRMQRSAVTAPTAADDTTATRTEWPQNHRAVMCSAERFAACCYPARFDHRLALLNTMAKPSQSCGWQISDWPVSWEALEGTIGPLFNSCHSSSPTPPADGSRNSLPTRSMIGLIWSGCSKATSKEPTYDPAIHGTSASASRNQEKLSESTLDASRSSAPSCRTSPTTMSSWPLSRAPPAEI